MSSGHLRDARGSELDRALSDPPDPAVAAAGPPPDPAVGPPWSIAAVRPDGPEVALVQRWMAAPHVAEFWQQDWPLADWSAALARQLAGAHSRPWLLALDGEPVAYVEVYRAARDVIAREVAVDPHDLGIHIAIGDPDRTGQGRGPRVLRAVVDGLFAADPRCARVLGDPDVAHQVARRAFAAAGFDPLAEVDLPHKRASLVASTRADRAAAVDR
ncbi:MAG: GNAT family N-acetyltransferase [Acidimicrobiales bacterium]|nr:GNAT family N-acetyltransferase [Acidimicrobiales bacterium]